VEARTQPGICYVPTDDGLELPAVHLEPATAGVLPGLPHLTDRRAA